jgi:small subunit ribosomal protein S16
MLAIKLQAIGKKHQRSFRLVVQEKREKLNGKSVEDLGWFNNHNDKFELNKDRIQYWLGVGAQPTDTAKRLLKKASVLVVKK